MIKVTTGRHMHIVMLESQGESHVAAVVQVRTRFFSQEKTLRDPADGLPSNHLPGRSTLVGR